MPLPDVLRFLAPGWWMVHAAAIWITYRYGYSRGRGDERRRQRDSALAAKPQ
jgi:hypothetical protein